MTARPSVSRETKRESYVSLLRRWGAALNLTSARNSSEVSLREQIDDCLVLLPHIPPGTDRIVDLGSGQGMPAIPLAIETGAEIEMIESDRRKAAFLATAMAQLGLRGTVHTSRIEASTLAPAACVTARALASLPILVAYTRPLLQAGGVGLFVKGPTVVAEAELLAAEQGVVVDLLPTPRRHTIIARFRNGAGWGDQAESMGRELPQS